MPLSSAKHNNAKHAKTNAVFEFYKQKEEELRLELGEQSVKALKYPLRRAELMDKVIALCAEEAGSQDLYALVAIGGYGRGELAPFSDVDLLFLHEEENTKSCEAVVEKTLQTLWSLGVKASHSVRSFKDVETALKSDVNFLTSLLEKRFLGGNKALYEKLGDVFAENMKLSPPRVFVAAKMAERAARHQKMGDTRFQLQPHVKEGKGGLRDIHTLFWLANLVYGTKTAEGLEKKHVLSAEEVATLKHAHDFFWRVRCHLHVLTRREEDRLNFDVQPEIARLMGYTDEAPNVRAEQFMKDYFRMATEVGHLTRILCAEMEAQSITGGATEGAKKMALEESIQGFALKNNRLMVENVQKSPLDIVRLFRVRQQSGYDIHPDVLRALRQHFKAIEKALCEKPEALTLFMEILLDQKKAEGTLRRMNEAGLLGAMLPAFRNIVAHMQYDMYHVFTADEHTLRAVGMLHRLENNELEETAPLATGLFKKIHSRKALYVAMFLHDIAKGLEGNHSGKGADIARELCPKLGLNPEETETVSWLVEQHLLMTFTALKRDLNDPKTISDFVAQVQSLERLKLLTILTTADIMAVGPERWNNWKAGMLTELHVKAEETLSGQPQSDWDVEQTFIMKKKVRRLIGTAQKTLEYIADYAPASFWFSFSAEAIADFVRVLQPEMSEDMPTLVKATPFPDLGHTEVVVYTPDRKGLFALLSGGMAASGASILDARIFTFSNGMAFDVFLVQNLNGHVYENAPFLSKTIKAALTGKINLAEEIAERQKGLPKKANLFSVQPRVIVDNNASAGYTLIEVNAKDRSGLLYDITSALSQAGLQIASAKVTTFGSRAVDVFYVKDSFGLKVVHTDKVNKIEKAVAAVL